MCWAHVRRYFTEALFKDMKSPEATLPATGIAYYNQLFNWERKFKELSPSFVALRSETLNEAEEEGVDKLFKMMISLRQQIMLRRKFENESTTNS